MSKLVKQKHLEADKLLNNLEIISKKLTSNRSKELSKFDLKKSTFDILYALLMEPGHQLKPSQLIKMTGITSGSLTTRVDKLVQKDLVQRVKNDKDKRIKSIKMKEKGLVLITEIVKTHNHELSKLIDPLTKDDCISLNYLLRKWLDANT